MYWLMFGFGSHSVHKYVCVSVAHKAWQFFSDSATDLRGNQMAYWKYN